MRSITKRFSKVNKELNARALGIQEETQANIKEVPSNDMEYNLRLIFIACITQLKVKVLLDPINKTEMAQFFGVTEESITEAIETYHVQYKANIKYENQSVMLQMIKDFIDPELSNLSENEILEDRIVESSINE